MVLVILAIVSYVITVIAGGLGYTGLARGASPLMRYVFAGALAVTLVLIIAAGFVVRRGV